MASLLVSLLMVALVAAGQTASPATGVVTGRVIDAATGEPIEGATVSLSPVRSSTSPAPPASPTLLRSLMNQTNVNGTFEIGGVLAGRWSIHADKEGYAPLAPGSQVIDVAGGAARVRDIRIDRGGAIIGRVLDSRGGPVVRMSVLATQQVRNRDGTVRLTGGASGQTNDLGEFRISGLVPGQYAVFAQPTQNVVNPFTGGSPTAAPSAYVRTFFPGASDPAQAGPVSVSRGGTTTGIEFSMLSAPSYQVFGVVVDTGGQPVGGAVVRLFQARPPLPATSFQASPSALDGTFVVVNVPEGRYSAQAAIPLVVKNANGGMSGSLRFGTADAAGTVEVVVQGAHVEGLRLVATPP